MTCLAAVALTPFDSKWEMTFHDEFDGKAGTAPSTANWERDLGGGGFGNNEWESYTDGAANAFLDGKGNLIIEARKEPTKGKDGIARDYSSARLKLAKSLGQQYGRVEARMKLPRGQGIWPAFWMLGNNIGHAGWPGCGEIDIMESVGHKPSTLFGTLHGPGYSGSQGKQGHLDVPKPLGDDFHVYAIEWDAQSIRWYLDDHLYNTVKPADVAPHAWPFDQPFFVILNLAVGGGWPGYPDATTVFPQQLVVDYVRMYKAKS
jgi:beta-glucanase (GH16 family)